MAIIPEKCKVKGKLILNRIAFADLTVPMRTEISYSNQSQKQYHIVTYPLQNLNTGMVTVFPLDYMHLVCLEVTKKLLNT